MNSNNKNGPQDCLGHGVRDLAAIRALVVQTTSPHGQNAGSGFPELTSSWRSRTATLYKFRVNQSPECDVVVKLLQDPTEAALLYHSICETNEALGEQLPAQVRPIQALGFSGELGAVVMPYIEGKLLVTMLQKERWTEGNETDKVFDWVTRCGSTLAAYHIKLIDQQGVHTEQAWQDLETRFQPVLGEAEFARKLTQDAIIARSYGDFHIGHFIVSSSNQLILLDPPLETIYTFVHRDLAWFIDKLFMFLLHPNVLSSGPFKIRFHQALTDRFLQGYTAGIGRSLSQADQILLNGFEAFLLWRRLQRLQSGSAVPNLIYYGLPVWYRYRRLRQILMRFIE